MNNTEPQFTPVFKGTHGPWLTQATDVYSPGPNGANVCSVSEPYASTMVGYTRVKISSKHLHESFANAQAISAVPDFIEACLAVVNASSYEEAVKAKAQCKSAIQKALNQQ